jgi:hypothetical protein
LPTACRTPVTRNVSGCRSAQRKSFSAAHRSEPAPCLRGSPVVG